MPPSLVAAIETEIATVFDKKLTRPRAADTSCFQAPVAHVVGEQCCQRPGDLGCGHGGPAECGPAAAGNRRDDAHAGAGDIDGFAMAAEVRDEDRIGAQARVVGDAMRGKGAGG